jgi:hypothetical protein
MSNGGAQLRAVRRPRLSRLADGMLGIDERRHRGRRRQSMKLTATRAAGFVVIMLLAATASALHVEETGVVGSWTFSAEGYVWRCFLPSSASRFRVKVLMFRAAAR